MDKQGTANGDFIKVPSKNNPGRYYLFNTKTGENQWLPSVKANKRDSSSRGTKVQNAVALPAILSPKIKKTPAQDRLKRLQHTIRLDHIQKDTKKSGRRTDIDLKKELKIAVTKEEASTSRANIIEPSTSRANKVGRPNKTETSSSKAHDMKPSTGRESRLEASTSRERSRSRERSTSREPSTSRSSRVELIKSGASRVESSGNSANKNPQECAASFVNARKRPYKTDRSPLNIKSPKMSRPVSECHQDATDVTASISSPTQPQNNDGATHDNNELPSTSGLSIFGRLKELLSNPLSAFKTKSDHSDSEIAKAEQKQNPDESNLNQPLETPFETKGAQQLKLGLPVSGRKFKTPVRRKSRMPLDLATCSGSTTSISASSNSSGCSTPKNIGIVQYQPGAANARLTNLRQSLMMQQQSSTTSDQTINTFALLVPFGNTLNLPTNPGTPFNLSFNCSLQLTNNGNYIANDEIEAMDWQSTEKTDVEGQSKSSVIKPTTAAETMGDIYDAVSDNLLRLSAEKSRDKNKNARCWLKDFYYFVVDTNVLLRCLSFVEDLSQLKLCDTEGSILFVPYSVLQELDRLKMRSGAAEGAKTLAVRAIKYLNNKFEKHDLHLQAQTAIEERRHKIDVNSADDSIINCCLQVKEHVTNMVLLTEDVNLRNKAICNDIVATTKSDLMQKRYLNTKENDRQ